MDQFLKGIHWVGPAAFCSRDVFLIRYGMIYLLTGIGLSPGGSSTVHIYTQTIHKTTQNKQHNNLGECGPCPVLASYILAFALQLRKDHG